MLTLLLEVGVSVSPGPRGAVVSGGRGGKLLSLVQAPLLIGSEVARGAQHCAGSNAGQLCPQEVGLCAWKRRVS